MNSMPNNSRSRNGVMQKVYAHDQASGAILGSGWIIIRDDGKMSPPDLFDIGGNKLPEGWYTLQVTGENKLVVIPRRKQ